MTSHPSIRARAGLRRRIRECLAGHGARPAHPDHRRLGMITKLLRYPSGTTRAAERPNGRSDGLPDLTRAGLIAAPQPRYEVRLSLKGPGANVLNDWPHHVPPVRSCRS